MPQASSQTKTCAQSYRLRNDGMTRLAVSFVIFACCRLLVHGATDDVDAATVSYDGELLLAAVLPLRTRDSASGRPCGPVQLMQGLRSLEALFVALDWLNNATLSPVKLPFRLGAIAYDCCQNAQVRFAYLLLRSELDDLTHTQWLGFGWVGLSDFETSITSFNFLISHFARKIKLIGFSLE